MNGKLTNLFPITSFPAHLAPLPEVNPNRNLCVDFLNRSDRTLLGDRFQSVLPHAGL